LWVFDSKRRLSDPLEDDEALAEDDEDEALAEEALAEDDEALAENEVGADDVE
jgi:hypothetical protein